MRTLRTVLIVAGLILLGIMYGHALATDPPQCVTEDSTACYWDAENQGNGTGESGWHE